MFVLPPRAEPFGIVVVEALAHGRPVVASAVAGPEIIEDGRSGILVRPDDPVARPTPSYGYLTARLRSARPHG